MFIIPVIYLLLMNMFSMLRNNLYIYALKIQIRGYLRANCTRKIIYEIDLVISR